MTEIEHDVPPTESSESSATGSPAARQAPEEVPRPSGIGPLGWLRWGWRQLTTMRTALILLFLVALGAVPGSVLPQRGQAPEKVAAYLEEHRTLGPWLDRFSMFDVFAAPWFAAIYILLFVSLAGCVVPRAVKHYRSMRARPPAAPRNLGRLPQSATYETDAKPDDVLAEAREVLRRRRFRVDVSGGAASAEKGYLGESGNLLFHLALLALLFALGLGNLFGYRGNVLLSEGKTFANSLSQYDQFTPGRAFQGGELAPFTVTLDDFKAEYEPKGDKRGQATAFDAHIRYRAAPDGAEKKYDLRLNHPLKVGGAKVYLLGHGYAPVFTVRDAKGNVAFQDSVPFLELEPRNLTSEGVIKVPDAEPDQLAFYAILWPTAVASEDGKQIVSAFPAPIRPVVTISSFKGDIGLDSGSPQSVYKLEGIGKTLHPVKDGQKLLEPGETFKLPDGSGSITFDGLREWTSLSVNHDPGRIPALIAAVLAVLGVATSFMVRRRRVWVRASAGEGGRTVVEVGGLTLGNPTPEFDEIVTALRGPDDGTGSGDGTDTLPGETLPGETEPAGRPSGPATEPKE
ncbi:cytochrome c biogenesis protein ResB [Actinomadura madurae]|uniref:cytochrome c biogenesis protein ResB n=1 Tax=Actinomadura madurae TaxID=1993 RepID=UPI0020D20822|nr:cytochrome c biogenesis protein ResB [Actinomadura madurae]MCP9952850.1 cytochrome c biogenesis protein ResB [Actinomadura madurae]MCP9969615.1 cytochrome c biogenesis protein ResB [Actinomadura madurae]MCQ0006404.1 cytochrome c biogenesis protein ResB [Actinomadura madurae]MCQ0018307.1 cytochrome c biogenesis protein ResB [Actinomadura madurae]